MTMHEPGSSNWSGTPGAGGSDNPFAISTTAEATTPTATMARHGNRAGGSGAAGVDGLLGRDEAG